MAPPLPRVVLLDVDGTLIGRIGAAACQYDLLRATGACKGKRLAAAKEDLVARLKHGIVRPHLDAFCRHAAAAGVELFVYTASDPRWAAFIVPCIEAALGVRFNRPLLTRKHCLPPPPGGTEFRKSLARVVPLVRASLRRRYPGLQGGVGGAADPMRGRVLLVDNTPGVVADAAEAPMVVTCPSYEYCYVFDVLQHVDVSALHRRTARVAPVLARYGLLAPGAPPPPGYPQLAQAYYERLARAISDTAAANVRALASDRFWLAFWPALAQALRRAGPAAPPFDEEGVRALRQAAGAR